MKEIVVLTNVEVYNRAVHLVQRIRSRFFGKEALTVYGVPRGGIPVAYSLTAFRNITVVDKPEDADVIVDDIVATGKTRERYNKLTGGKPFFALIEYPVPGTWTIFPWEGTTLGSVDDIPTRFIEYLGEDPNRDGLKDSPARVVRSWKELYSGYETDPKSVITVFDNEEHYDEMVTLEGCEVYSTCEHHFLPFFGKATISYIPGRKIIGISKLARIVDVFSRRLQVQERLTKQIADFIQTELDPVGVGVMIKARHLCMISRGVKQSNAWMTTTSLKGIMKEDSKARAEFLNACGR